jgi:hypothetical protein
MSFEEYDYKPYKTEFTRELVKRLILIQRKIKEQLTEVYNEEEKKYYRACYDSIYETIKTIEKLDELIE